MQSRGSIQKERRTIILKRQNAMKKVIQEERKIEQQKK